MRSRRALVLFSGGQDSTVCLAWALERFARVETIGFDYGQRHRAELEVRPRVRERIAALRREWAARLGDDHMIKLDALAAISDTALTRDVAIEIAENGLPTTFVPGRNLVFFTFAGALAYRRGAKHLVAGMCETDFSGYPDCRDDTIKAMQVALNARHGSPLRHPYAADVDRQGRDLRAGARDRRPRVGRSAGRGDPHLLSRRPLAPARLGLWLRDLSGLPAAGGRICESGRPTC